MWLYRHIEEDGVVVGKVVSERHAVSGKPSVKLILFGFHLHVVAEHTLTSITVIRRGGQECFKHDADKSRPWSVLTAKCAVKIGKPLREVPSHV